MTALDSARGVMRSLRMYYGNPDHVRRMTALYGQFMRSGDLAFDIGAHVGSRTLAWSRLGCRVVAVEPVPQAVRVLRLLFGRSRRVAVVAAAVGASPGTLPMLVCEREPTVSTLSAEWADRMLRERHAFARTRWDHSIQVPVTTLDALIEAFGVPAFCKIDTEGYDVQVLHGLSTPLPALSFEYVPPALDLAEECVERLQVLDHGYEYNWSPGETMRLQWQSWVDAKELTEYLRALPPQSNPGDIYVRLTR